MNTAGQNHELLKRLRARAAEAGALELACIRPEHLHLSALRQRYTAWMQKAANQSALPYITRSLEMRLQPFASRPWARCALIILFKNDWDKRAVKFPDLPPPAGNRPGGLISAYAAGRDYHSTGHAILASLAELLQAECGQEFKSEACIDTAAVPEVFLAVSAGLGLPGRHGLLRSPDHGSRVFIGTLFISKELPETPHPAIINLKPVCADCGACSRNCPTAALEPDGLLNVRRCRSFLSMEHRGLLTAAQQSLLGNALFGCDACTACCPPGADSAARAVDLEWLLLTPAAEIRRRIAGTALAYAGVTLLRRNAVAILGSSHAAEAAALMAHAAQNSGSRTVRATAEIALANIQ